MPYCQCKFSCRMYRLFRHVCICIGRFEESLAYELKQFGFRTVISELGVVRTNFQSVVAKKAVLDVTQVLHHPHIYHYCKKIRDSSNTAMIEHDSPCHKKKC